jgi:hypothetical protein
MASTRPFEKSEIPVSAYTPQRGRFVSTDVDYQDCQVHCESVMEGNGNGIHMHNESSPVPVPALPLSLPFSQYSNSSSANRRVEDITAKILDRVSRITISADSWSTTSSPSDGAAEVSFTSTDEEEDAIKKNNKVSNKASNSKVEGMPSMLKCTSPIVTFSLAPSPLRATGRTKRKSILPVSSPMTEIANTNANADHPCLTPRVSNILPQPRRKRRRPALLPSSPISSNSKTVPFFLPFVQYDRRIDRIAAQELAQTTDSMYTYTTIENPFTGVPPTPNTNRRDRRLCPKPFPYFPCLEQKSPMSPPQL